MQRTDESLAASPSIHAQEHVQEWAEGVYALFKAHQVELISFVPDGGHKRLIACCQSDPALRTVALTTEEEGIALAAGAFLGGAACYSCNRVGSGTASICFLCHACATCRFSRS